VATEEGRTKQCPTFSAYTVHGPEKTEGNQKRVKLSERKKSKCKTAKPFPEKNEKRAAIAVMDDVLELCSQLSRQYQPSTTLSSPARVSIR